MPLKHQIHVIRVETEPEHERAIEVLRATYGREKNWVTDDQKLLPAGDLANPAVSWFLTLVENVPVGVLRVLYDPPLELYREYGFQPVGAGIDVDAFIGSHRIAEIGRFAVLPEYRRFIFVAGALMRAASLETIERNYTHYITDVFEGETHSPYLFHTRVMGFEPVATHETGELNCPNRRITMVLDLPAAYRRLKSSQGWLYRFLTEGWPAEIHERLSKPDTELELANAGLC